MTSLKIGSHVSFSGKGLLSAAEEAASYGSTTFMVYTGAPQNTVRKPMSEQYVDEGWALARENGIEEIVVHAPYIINLASPKKDTFELAVEFLTSEIERTEVLMSKDIVLHPGAFTDRDVSYGTERIVDGLNTVLSHDHEVRIALETMAGKGTEIGRRFEEIAEIIEKNRYPERLSVCFDTCHTHDAGYDLVHDLDGTLETFDRIIGLERLTVVHMNDSKNPRGAMKDRHAPLGSGYIGYEALKAVVRHPALSGRPFILETPWIGEDKKTERPMYEIEIALLMGNVEERFGKSFWADVERIDHFFLHHEPYATWYRTPIEGKSGARSVVLHLWDVFRTSSRKGRKKGAGDMSLVLDDLLEPMPRLYREIRRHGLFPELSEEAVNHRLIGWFAFDIEHQ
ncbi:MAG: deoxyribonuclease IV [Candidatus Carbobacillus altaicus]|nr:deoxyribonuclease IV [Candidatus Carbobacillus altaicus]